VCGMESPSTCTLNGPSAGSGPSQTWPEEKDDGHGSLVSVREAKQRERERERERRRRNELSWAENKEKRGRRSGRREEGRRRPR
jgi:hypothetical protein